MNTSTISSDGRLDGKTNLAEVRAATPSTYHGPHNNGYLDEELAWLSRSWVCRRGLFLEVCDDRGVRRI